MQTYCGRECKCHSHFGQCPWALGSICSFFHLRGATPKAQLDAGIRPSGFESCVTCVNFRSSVLFARTLAHRQQKQAQLTAAKHVGPYWKDGRSLLESESQNQQRSDEGPGARTADSLQGEDVSLDSRVSVPGEGVKPGACAYPVLTEVLTRLPTLRGRRFPKGNWGVPPIKMGAEC